MVGAEGLGLLPLPAPWLLCSRCCARNGSFPVLILNACIRLVTPHPSPYHSYGPTRSTSWSCPTCCRSASPSSGHKGTSIGRSPAAAEHPCLGVRDGCASRGSGGPCCSAGPQAQAQGMRDGSSSLCVQSIISFAVPGAPMLVPSVILALASMLPCSIFYRCSRRWLLMYPLFACSTQMRHHLCSPV